MSAGAGRACRLALVSSTLPPGPTGQARVLEQLLGPGIGCSQVLMSDEQETAGKSGALGAHVAYRQLAAARFLLVPGLRIPVLHPVNNALGLNRTIVSRGREIARAVRESGATVVVGCSGSPFDLPATFLASRWTGKPAIAYLFDDPVFQWPSGMYRGLARFWERLWMPRVAGVVVPNEVLAADVRSRNAHVQNLRIVRNPVASKRTRSGPSAGEVAAGTDAPRRIVYTGSIYHAQADAFRNLLLALERLGGRYRLHVYTAQSEQALAEHGVEGRHVARHAHVTLEEARLAQERADVLFLPLAFRSSIQEVVRSSAPAKMGEYLASARPVLVHAPEDSFVSTFFTEHRCGAVVVRLEPDALVTALRALEDEGARGDLVGNALRVSGEFDVERAREGFWDLVRGVGEGRRA